MDGKALAVLAAVISGFSIFVNKFAVGTGDPAMFTAAKNSLVAVALLAAIFLGKEKVRLGAKQWLNLALIGLVGGSVPFLLFFNGLSKADAANAALIHKSLFVFAGIFSTLLLKERIEKKFFVSAAAIIAGNALLLGIAGAGFGEGEMMVLAATVLWGLEQVLSKSALREIRPVQVAAGRMLFGAVFILAYLTATSGLKFSYSLEQLEWTGITGAFLLAYVVVWYSALALEKVSTATALLSLGSVITTLLSAVFSGVAVTAAQSAGLLLLVISAVALCWPARELRTQSHSAH